MPLYSTFCARCQKRDTIYRPIAARDDVPTCACGEMAFRILDAPAIRPDIEPYVSPNGTLVNSRAQRTEDLKRSNAIAWEPGIEKDIARRKEANIAESFKPISDSVDQTVRDLVSSGRLENL